MNEARSLGSLARRFNRPPSNLLVAVILLLVIYVFHLHINDLHEPTYIPASSSTPLSKDAAQSGGSVSSPSSIKSEKLRIGIITMTTSENTYTHLSLSNKDEYARKHGYDLTIDWRIPKGTKGRGENDPVWHKLTMLENAIATNKYDWIWWLDFDTLIMNSTITVESIIKEALNSVSNPDDTDMLLTADCFPLNAGSMLFRSRPSLSTIITEVRRCGEEHSEGDSRKNEQDCLRDLLLEEGSSEKKTTVGKRALWIPQWKINSFPRESKCTDKHGKSWEPGMFVIHFAGVWAHVKVENAYGVMMHHYAPHIDTNSEPPLYKAPQ